MPDKIKLSLVRKVRKFRADKGLGLKAIAKLMPPTKKGKRWDIKQVTRYWNYGIRMGIVTPEDVKRNKTAVKKFYPKSG